MTFFAGCLQDFRWRKVCMQTSRLIIFMGKGSEITEKNSCNKISVEHNLRSQSDTQTVCFGLIN